MIRHPMVKKMVWLAGTLLVGALGSGLWEAILKPGFVWVTTGMLDVATLGLASLRDGMYEEVARGVYERAALYMLLISIGGSIGLFGGGMVGAIRVRRKLAQESSPPATRRMIVMLVALPIALTFLLVQVFRLSYVVRASSYIEQLQRIAAPAMPAEKRLLYRSRIAQVVTRDEFVLIVDELTATAKEAGFKVPSFVPY